MDAETTPPPPSSVEAVQPGLARTVPNSNNDTKEGESNKLISTLNTEGGVVGVQQQMNQRQFGLRNAPSVIQEGDLVILYGGRDTIYPVRMAKGGIHNNKYGTFRHDDAIGRAYGSKIVPTSRPGAKRAKSNEHMYVLLPTPELYTAGALTHRTQIIYTSDIATITFYLEISSGCIVLESGTGSGSLSRAFARIVAPKGHLYTFEFHQQRAEAATQDFKNEGLSDYITVTHRDACVEGFKMKNIADAVFLDLPRPYQAVQSAHEALKIGGKICVYTPSVEQAHKSYEVMRPLGFTELQTIECRLRPFSVHNMRIDSYEYLDQIDEAPSVTDAKTENKEDKVDDNSQSLNNSVNVQSDKMDLDEKIEATTPAPSAVIGAAVENVNDSTRDEAENGKSPVNQKRKRDEEENGANKVTVVEIGGAPTTTSSRGGRGAGRGRGRGRGKEKKLATTKTMLVTRPHEIIAGHTGFLTFARKSPFFPATENPPSKDQ